MQPIIVGKALAALSLLVCVSLVMPSQASQTSTTTKTTTERTQAPVCRYVQVPVYYMTDRAPVRTFFGPERIEETEDIYRLHCGRLDYVLENYLQKDPAAFKDSLGWQSADKPGKLVFTNNTIEFTPEDDVYEKFGKVISEAAQKSGSNEIFICVHGFNNNFAAAAAKAARLAYNVQRPVILYSWPSTGKLMQYNVDSGNNEWSQEHFNRLMEEMIELREKTGLKVNILAHSMGNRLAVRSIPITAGKHLFDQVFLVDPDIDAETFFHYVVRYLHKDKKEKESSQPPTVVRILFSRKDRALPIAQMIFGGYTRLGQGADTALESLLNPTQIPDVLHNTTKALVDNLNPANLTSKPPAPAAECLRQRLRDAFEWIDFTAIDHGFIGHTIPYEMIASLWSTGKPGPGLAMTTEEAGQVNKLTRMIARHFKQNQRLSELGRTEKVVLVKDTSNQNKPDETSETPYAQAH
jgi:esterase/lipase superfamily enzyme